MYYELDITPRAIIGADTRTKVGHEARRLGFARALVVTDLFHEQSGRADEIVHLLNAAGIEASVYAGVTAEPDTKMCERGIEQFRADKCDGIVALGGGSPIDTAKTISVLTANENPVGQYMGNDAVPESGAGVIALPTTSGTGSEATRVVVIADAETRLKMSGRSHAYLPKVAILDHRLTMSMPKSLAAATGVDALTHAIEAYVSKKGNHFSNLLALSAAKLIWGSIRQAWNDGSDEKARENMLIGSFQAGIAFSNSSVGLVHSMSEPLGACFHVPHGLSNAMLLPEVTKFSIDGAPAKYAEIAHSLHLADSNTSEEKCCRILIDQLMELNQELEIPSPKTFGIDEESYEKQVEKMTNDATAATSTANNPIAATAGQIKDIYRSAYTG